MQAHAADAGVFIRSMATRGHLGGLARATADAALVLDAAGKDVVLIETVGVGQDEVDIVRTADISIVMLVPGTGDDVQALKAGIMEIADIFVVNKADREGADRLVASIEAMLSLQSFGDGRVAAADREDRSDDRQGHRRAGRRDRAVPRAHAATERERRRVRGGVARARAAGASIRPASSTSVCWSPASSGDASTASRSASRIRIAPRTTSLRESHSARGTTGREMRRR